MTERVLGPTGGRRRKRMAVFVPFLMLAALILAIGASADTSTDAKFEGSDGNLDAAACSTAMDWNCFYAESGTPPVRTSPTWTGTSPDRIGSALVNGWEFTGIEDDQNNSNDNVFAGGTKQDDDCAKVGDGPKPPNKDDLKRIYISSTTGSDGHVYLALAWARIPQNTTSASAHVAFEFNQNDPDIAANQCPAGSDSLVKRSTANGGDMLIVYDFEGGSDPVLLKLLRWKTSGTCEQTGKAATSSGCWVKDETFTDWAARVNTTTATDTIAPAGQEELQTQEFGEAIIDLTPVVFPATPTSCLSFGRAFGVSRSSGNSGQAQMKDLVGPADVDISNCGSVVVKKVTKDVSGTVITTDATEFTFSTNVQTLPGGSVADFNLTGRPEPATPPDTKTISNVVAGMSRTVTESAPPSPYALVNINCVGGSNFTSGLDAMPPTRTATFDLAAGETVTCTFTNQIQVQPSTISTVQTVYPNDAATVTGTTGNVTFELFGPFADAASVSCSSTANRKFMQTVAQTSGVATTTNYPGVSGVTAYGVVNASEGWYGWQVTAAASTGYEGRRSSCDETVNIQITDYAGNGVKFP